MQLLVIVISGAAAVAISENSGSDSYIALPEEVEAMPRVIWFGVSIMGLYTGVSLWAVVQLVHATELVICTINYSVPIAINTLNNNSDRDTN